MKNPLNRMLLLVAASGLLVGLSSTVAAADNDPIILCHPRSQTIKKNKKAKFEVVAKVPMPSFVHQTLLYQWQLRGPGLTNFVDIAGATNSTFKIAHVTTNDVAYYRVNVTSSYYSNTVSSEPAQLLVYTKNSPLTVYGSPVVSRGSPAGSCPGDYIGYVFYDKGSSWGWTGDHPWYSTHKAEDRIGSDTKVEAFGYEDDLICEEFFVRCPHPGPYPGSGEDSKYVFAIFFPAGTSVPTVPYPITFTGLK